MFENFGQANMRAYDVDGSALPTYLRLNKVDFFLQKKSALHIDSMQ
jgi:hypothetical protein